MVISSKEYSSTVREATSTSRTLRGDSIVISGISGLYPKSQHVKELSEMLYDKVNPVSSKPRWNYAHPEVVQHAGNVPGLNRFDAQFFKVHFRLANSMDPMCRKSLEQAYQAIYDAGISPEDLNGRKVGVFIGTCFSETEKTAFYIGKTRTGLGIAGCNKSMFANRISYWLNAKGPSMAIDEACCSSMAALEQGFLAITRGDCEAAIIGSASLNLHPQSSVHYGRIVTSCTDGKTKSFDANADGCTKTEAINVMLIQKARDAKRVYAEVLHVKNEFTQLLEGGTGPKYGFCRDPETVSQFLNQFYEEANLSPEAVEYVEAFGSATLDADKLELEAIDKIFCKSRKHPLYVGSVMSNIGYSEASSGLSAITKVLLGYQKGAIPANLHCANPRKDVAALREGRIRIVTDHHQFKRSYTAINGMSLTGINAHVLLHGNYKPKDLTRYKSAIPHLVTISARQDTSVQKIFDDLKTRTIDPEELALFHNIHRTRITGHLGRGYIILDTNKEKQTVSLAETFSYFDDAKRPLWFVYSGMGSQWAGMGAQLMRIPIFAEAIERCHRALEPKGVDIVHIITSPDKAMFDNILHSFVGIAAVQIGLTDILKAVGIEPDMIIGHSVGELGCAYADGCFTTEEMILSAYYRGLVSVQTPFIRGSMAAVGIGYEQISKLIPPEIEVACHNGPDSSTISGPADIMQEFVAKLTTQNIFAKEVPCSNIAYHSRYIAEAGPVLLKYLKEIIKYPKPRSERWLSTSVQQDKWNDSVAKTSSAEYHTNNLLNPVMFDETSRLVPGNAVLVEVAPHGLLQAILKRSLPDTCKHIPMTRRGHTDNSLLVLDGIGKLYMEGYSPKIHALYPRVEFPVSTGTPMLSHLVEWAHGETWTVPLYASAHRTSAAACKFTSSIHDDEHSYIQGHMIRGKVLYPFSAALVAAWDTLAMTLLLDKKEPAVEFRDVHLYVQPILHDLRQLKINVRLLRGTGRFEVLEDDRKVATGYVLAVPHSTEKALKVPITATEKLDVKAQDIYQAFYERDYSYSGDFRSIRKANATLTEAQLTWNNNWVTFLDGILQLNALKHDHDGVSTVCHIRKITIDTTVHLHELNNINKSVLTAKLYELEGYTRCGGVVVVGVQFKDLPPLKKELVVLKALKFVPRFQSNIDVTQALQIYLQIVSENSNKESMNVVEILKYDEEITVFDGINNILEDLTGINVHFKPVRRVTVTSMQEYLSNDLILVQNLSANESLWQLLYRSLPRDSFIINAEEIIEERIRPSTLYRIVSSMIIDNLKLSLIRWRPHQTSAPSAVVTMKAHSDLDLLVATRLNNPQRQKLVALSPYPPIPGLKELVKKWRKESERNQVYMVMISDKDSLDHLPELHLAFNVVDHGVWGGEYYTPWRTFIKDRGVTLRSGRVGDFSSLHWVDAPEAEGSGVPVTVHYAAINNTDVKRAAGVIPFKQEMDSETAYGMDFSGITDGGTRVMGILPNGAVSGRVIAQPELLWPVPEHWNLEDAASVPSAYLHAFYCLSAWVRLKPGMRILIHGGSGALGQAMLSIALAIGCEVFTTVGDIRKKRFLLRLFPDLKDDHVGNSRDTSFGDMVMSLTEGAGCDVVICSLKGELKNVSRNCGATISLLIDVAQVPNQERFSFGMYHLGLDRNYVAIDFNSIFHNPTELKEFQGMLSEGIARGYVRPLSRVTYAPDAVTCAFRLLAASRHRGRVLLRMQNTDMPVVEPRMVCSPDLCHLLLCNEDNFGLQLANRLIKRGARKLLLHFNNLPNHLFWKIRSWEKLGVNVQTSTVHLNNSKSILVLLNESSRMGPLEGIYVISTSDTDDRVDILTTMLENLDLFSRELHAQSIKYFAVLNAGSNIGQYTCQSRYRRGLPATVVNLSMLNNKKVEPMTWRAACDATERALCSAEPTILAYSKRETRTTLLQQIANVADLLIKEDATDDLTLQDLGIEETKVPAICSFLCNEYNVSLAEEVIPSLTIQQIRQFEATVTGFDFKETRGLKSFFSYVATDELLATTEMMFLPTLTNSANTRADEFDVTQEYLCIIPGMEGFHERFRVLCEQLKLPALVLQPGLDHAHETLRDTAERFAEIILKRTELKEKFCIMGYECGVIVALEIAAILEECGLTGTVYCVGGTTEEFQATLEDQLRDFDDEEALQKGVIQHMYSLMAGNTDGLGAILQVPLSWQEKIRKCTKMLIGKVPHSAQFAGALIETVYTRIQQARTYKQQQRKLRSQLILLHASGLSQPSNTTPGMLLQKLSEKPVIVYELRAPLAQAAEDLRCPSFINRHLSAELLDAFEKKNLCETYLLNAESFMTFDENLDDFL